MDKEKINSVVDSAFDSSFENWSKQIERELYPAAFANEYSWSRVKNSMQVNNSFLKEALKHVLSELLCE